MERIIGVNPVIEVLQNKEKNIEKLEMFKGNKDEKLNKIKKLASERNIKIFYTDKKDMVFIKHDVDDILDKIEFYYNNYELLRKLAEEGKITTKKSYSYETQLKPRIKVIEESIKGGNEWKKEF